MNDLLNNILANINTMQAIIAAVVALLVSIAVGIRKVKEAYKQGSGDMLELVQHALPEIVKQEPKKDTNEAKNLAVSQVLLDAVPKKTKKKFGLDTVEKAIPVVSLIYSAVKGFVVKR